MLPLRRLSLLLLALTSISTACSTSKQSVRDDSAAAWLEPSPALQRRIEDEARRLPWTHGVERVDLIHWFASLGEPAYPTLLEMVADPRRDVAIAALAALGATRDSRLVTHLRAVPVPEGSESKDLELERARTLLRLGDWEMAPRLIQGLRDERLYTRALCAQALTEATRESFGFDPKGEAAPREAAVARWEAWWQERVRDTLLPVRNAKPRAED